MDSVRGEPNLKRTPLLVVASVVGLILGLGLGLIAGTRSGGRVESAGRPTRASQRDLNRVEWEMTALAYFAYLWNSYMSFHLPPHDLDTLMSMPFSADFKKDCVKAWTVNETIAWAGSGTLDMEIGRKYTFDDPEWLNLMIGSDAGGLLPSDFSEWHWAQAAAYKGDDDPDAEPTFMEGPWYLPRDLRVPIDPYCPDGGTYRYYLIPTRIWPHRMILVSNGPDLKPDITWQTILDGPDAVDRLKYEAKTGVGDIVVDESFVTHVRGDQRFQWKGVRQPGARQGGFELLYVWSVMILYSAQGSD